MKNLKKFSILTVAAFGLAAAASAQQVEKQGLKVELGAWFPTFSVNGVSKNTGVTYALGYTFSHQALGANGSGVDYEVELRGNTYRIGVGGNNATVTFGQLLGNVNFHGLDHKLFGGIHLGLGKGEARVNGVTFGDDDVRFVYGAQVGYNFNQSVYGIVRYTTTNEDVYRGFSVGVGYRF